MGDEEVMADTQEYSKDDVGTFIFLGLKRTTLLEKKTSSKNEKIYFEI